MRRDSVSGRAPVVVVGAGPTGVLLAIELALRGVQVRIFDRSRSRSAESRAIGIHARTLEVFHQLGIVEEFLELGHRVDGVLFHTRSRRTAQARFGGLASPYPFLLTLSQEETQRILDERLQSLGVTVDRGVTVVGIRQEADGAELLMRRAGDQREQTLEADWVVGCDGAHSIVRRCLGVPFDGEDYGQDWLMADVNVDSPLRRDCFHVFARTASPLPMFPLPGRRWRVFLPQVPDRSVAEREPPVMEEIERLVAARGPAGMRLTDPTLLAAFRCYRRHAKTMRQGCVFVAGDAAHIHSPAGGQGLNTGLNDAHNLGWKLALVARGQAPPALLDTYQAERAPIAGGVLSLTHALVRTFAMRSPRKRWLRDRIVPRVLAVPAAERRYITRMSQLSHSYRGGPLAPGRSRFARHGLVPGDRLPHVSGLEVDGRPASTLDLLESPAHTLFIFTGTRGDPETVRARFGRWDPIVRTVVIDGGAGAERPRAIKDPNLRAHRRLGALRGQLLLVRPDGHLACSAPLNRPDIPERYLERLTAGGERPRLDHPSGSTHPWEVSA